MNRKIKEYYLKVFKYLSLDYLNTCGIHDMT